MDKKIKILISVSLLLNVLLIGILIGSFSNRLLREEFPRKPPKSLAEKLPPDKEKIFFNTMEKVNLENREVHKQIGGARERVLSILRAPQFDETAYQAEVEQLGKLHNLIIQRFENATKELAKQFNQEERKILADYLRRPPPPPPGQVGALPRGGPPPPGPPPRLP